MEEKAIVISKLKAKKRANVILTRFLDKIETG